MIWTKFKKDKNSGPDAAKDGSGGTGCKVFFKNDGSLNAEDKDARGGGGFGLVGGPVSGRPAQRYEVSRRPEQPGANQG
jgi:hypothetical protein